jgi:peptidyl-prolyl cis-trans isomerase-like protein 2
MGKKQHSQDRMYITATEWKRDFGGHKEVAASQLPRLALDCCSLSFQPFEHPVCTASGHIFELENIVPFVQKYHKNPVTNEPLELGALIKLKFARNAEGQSLEEGSFAGSVLPSAHIASFSLTSPGDLQCPVTFKQFTENTHVVALKTTGNVYSYDAIDQLCLKVKSMKDLLDDSPFTRADLITLQDPHNILARDPSTFAHISNEDVARQVDGLKSSKGGAASLSSSSAAPAAAAPAAASSAAAAPKPGGRRPLSLGISLAPAPSAASAAAASLSTGSGPARAMYSSGAVSGSFTSTAVSVATKNERALLTPEQILQQRYDHLKKTKAKGYVRLSTNLGNINLEIHCDLVPRTGHNFLELCERGYYKDTRFHRVIPGFMVQGACRGVSEGG